MFNSEILEVAIGLIFVFILVSLICSAVREGIEGWLKSRAAFLEYGLRELLHGRGATGIVKSFYEHPLISGLFFGSYEGGRRSERPRAFSRGRNLPSYIPARNFALTLLDIAARGPGTDGFSSNPNAPVISLLSLRENVRNLQSEPVQRVLLTAIDAAQGDLNRAQAHLEAWFDSAMDRVSGAYKRATQLVIFLIGLGVAVVLNVDTISIVDFLYSNDAARAAVVAHAERLATDPADTQLSESDVRGLVTLGESVGLPLGWTWQEWENKTAEDTWLTSWATALLGWLLTAFAATLGAPFWFDVLNKVMVIRSTVKPHEKSPEEASEDRQRRVLAPPVGSAVPSPAGATADTGAGGPAPSHASTHGAMPPPAPVSPPSPGDPEIDVDGCEVDFTTAETLDEDLPEAVGGVVSATPNS